VQCTYHMLHNLFSSPHIEYIHRSYKENLSSNEYLGSFTLFSHKHSGLNLQQVSRNWFPLVFHELGSFQNHSWLCLMYAQHPHVLQLAMLVNTITTHYLAIIVTHNIVITSAANYQSYYYYVSCIFSWLGQSIIQAQVHTSMNPLLTQTIVHCLLIMQFL